MAELDIPVSDRVLEAIKRMAIDLYGNDTDASCKRVVELALEMRILWSSSVEKGEVTDEALTTWQFPSSEIGITQLDRVQEWLFRR